MSPILTVPKAVQVMVAAVLPGLLASAQPQTDKNKEKVQAEQVRLGGDEKKMYFLLTRAGQKKAPGKGFRLLVVLPGGDGSAGFQPFVRRILQNALSDDYVIAQVVAPKWNDGQRVVWPTKKVRVRGQRFTTEELIEIVVADVRRRLKVDRRHVYCLAWSSSGPAVYAASLGRRTQITGYFISMSVFKPHSLPPLKTAKGRRFYIEHSREDAVCPFRMAEAARDRLRKAGATVEFTKYEGGHGWRGDVFGRIRKGVEWLEKESGKRRRDR